MTRSHAPWLLPLFAGALSLAVVAGSVLSSFSRASYTSSAPNGPSQVAWLNPFALSNDFDGDAGVYVSSEAPAYADAWGDAFDDASWNWHSDLEYRDDEPRLHAGHLKTFRADTVPAYVEWNSSASSMHPVRELWGRVYVSRLGALRKHVRIVDIRSETDERLLAIGLTDNNSLRVTWADGLNQTIMAQLSMWARIDFHVWLDDAGKVLHEVDLYQYDGTTSYDLIAAADGGGDSIGGHDRIAAVRFGNNYTSLGSNVSIRVDSAAVSDTGPVRPAWPYTDGSLDSGHGTNGTAWATPTLGGDTFTATAATMDRDRRTVVVGKAGTSKLVVARFLPDGTPDASFVGDGVNTVADGDGVVVHSMGSNAEVEAVTVDWDGNIFVGGDSGATGSSVWLRHLAAADGSLVKADSFSATSASLEDMVYAKSQDVVYSVGSADGGLSGRDLAVYAYSVADQAPATSFGTNGIRTRDINTGTNDRGFAVGWDEVSKRVVVAGNTPDLRGDLNLFIAVFNTDGTMSSFNTTGQRIYDVGSNDIEPVAVHTHMRGYTSVSTYTVAATHKNGTDWDPMLVRVSIGSALDTTFDGDGWMIMNRDAGTTEMLAYLPQTDDRAISVFREGSTIVLAKTLKGSLQSSFGTFGYVVSDAGFSPVGAGLGWDNRPVVGVGTEQGGVVRPGAVRFANAP